MRLLSQYRLMGVACLIVSSACSAIAEGATLIKHATLFDGTGRPPYTGDLLIENGRIAQIGTDIDEPADTIIIDAEGKALLPGFFDLHVHWTPAGEPSTLPDIAEQYVIHGVTTVTDFHSAPESYAPKRKWLANLSAPHVAFAARMSTPGGHGAMWADNHTTYKISTPEDARVAMEYLSPYKPDLIKLFADGWRYGRKEENTSMDEQTMAAMVEAAHPLSLPVVGHVVTVDRAKKAVRAGMDVLVHAIQDADADDELVRLMVEKGTLYSPSLAVYEITDEKRAYYDEAGLKMAEQRHRHSMNNLKRFHDAGIPVAVGTDAGMPKTPHGPSTLHEMELLVEGGLTPFEALIAGTKNSAEALNVLDDRGTLEEGKRADIILIDGAPWQNISDVHNIASVWIDGQRLADKNGLLAPQSKALPEALRAQKLIDDFESDSGRTALNTVYIDHRDSGVGHSRSLSQRYPKADGNGFGYMMQAELANRESPQASVRIHFTPGAVVPIDASAFKGVSLEIRGEGDYFVRLHTPKGHCDNTLKANATWQTAQLPFESFCDDAPLNTRQLLMIEVGRQGQPGEQVWMQLDNLSFY